MHQPRSSGRAACGSLVISLAILFLASACAPGAATRLSGVGCADPSCREVEPETRQVIGCIGEAACNEPPPPSAAKTQVAAEVGSSPPQAVAETETDASVPSAQEADADEPEEWKIKVYYQRNQRQ